MSQPEPKYNPVSPRAREIIALFEEALADVRFPDLDLPRLLSERDALAKAQLEVEALEASLFEAQALVRERAAALAATTDRALAYARVFADGHPPIAARLSALGSAATSEAPAAKKRGRPRRVPVEAPRRLGAGSEQGDLLSSEELLDEAPASERVTDGRSAEGRSIEGRSTEGRATLSPPTSSAMSA